MAKRRVAKMKYFHGDVELVGVVNQLVTIIEGGQFAQPGPLSRPRQPAGKRLRDPSRPLTHDDLRWLPVTRTVRYLATPGPHRCDWRCEGGKPGGDCMCECMGRNHGRAFRCEAA